MLKKSLVYFFLALVYILLAELALSLFDPESVFVKSFDDKLLFSMYPDKSGVVVSEEYKVTVNTNEYGGRQELTSTAYPILLMGDSFSEGWGVEEKESFVSIANGILPSDLKIRNMGVHGSCPSLMYIHLKEYLTIFKPRVVYLQLFDNDLDDLDKLEPFMLFENGNPIPKKPLAAKLLGTYLYNKIKESSIFRLGKRAMKFAKGGVEPILYYKKGREPNLKILNHKESLEKFGKLSAIGHEIDKKYNGQFEFYAKPEDQLWKTRLEKEIFYLDRIYELLGRNEIELRIIYIPAKEFFAPGGILGNEKHQSLAAFETKNAHFKNIKRFCDTKRIGCMMGTEFLWNKIPENLYFPFDAHWNREGHELFGKMLASDIQASFQH